MANRWRADRTEWGKKGYKLEREKVVIIKMDVGNDIVGGTAVINKDKF